MPRTLLILRHGKSDWESGASRDFDRPLAPRGLRDVPRMGQWMVRKSLIPDLVISSPAERAKHTAELVCKELGYSLANIQWDPSLYGANLEDLLFALKEVSPDTDTVMLVGHNPGLEDLTLYLGKESHVNWDEKLLPTAALAHLSLSDSWEDLGAARSSLEQIVRPKELGD